jgi:ABC-2 type transport system permease protein
MTQTQPSPRAAERDITFNLLKNLTLREIRAEYKRTALGRVWSLINPLAQIAVYSLVFGLILRVQVAPGENSGIEFFPAWIGVGVIVWGFISGSISAGMGSLMSNAGLLTKVYFPRWVLVVSTVLAKASTFATELVLLYAALLIPLLVLTCIFALGIALLLSVASVYFRDLQHLWTILAQVWMYASGVMFSVDIVRGAERALEEENGISLPLVTLFELNPAERFLTAYRDVLYDFTVPGWDVWLQLVAWSAISLIIGSLVFRRLARNIVEEI